MPTAVIEMADVAAHSPPGPQLATSSRPDPHWSTTVAGPSGVNIARAMEVRPSLVVGSPPPWRYQPRFVRMPASVVASSAGDALVGVLAAVELEKVVGAITIDGDGSRGL